MYADTPRTLRRSGAPLGAVLKLHDAGLARAMGAAVHRPVRLHAMADHLAPAVRALRGHGVNRALERIVVLVTAHLALRHCATSDQLALTPFELVPTSGLRESPTGSGQMSRREVGTVAAPTRGRRSRPTEARRAKPAAARPIRHPRRSPLSGTLRDP